MGMYTELAIGVEFKEDVPEEVVAAISSMVDGNRVEGYDHPLFSKPRHAMMLRSGGSYYFAAQPCLRWKHDDISRSWFLTVWTNIKNYEDEWEAFLDFIAPHIEERGYIGHMRYEEDDEPTLLYAEDGAIQSVRAASFTGTSDK